jgi:hypothetical protein
VVPSVAASAPPAPIAPPGRLVLKIKPRSELVLDGRTVGSTSSQEMQLSAGSHSIVLNHPDFEPFRRLVEIRGGQTLTLTVNLSDQGIRRKK